MNDNGYVYVLINPSMKGLVKIGKSARSSQERAAELSSTKGVPTPFVVVYDYFFECCTKAEQYVHTYLESKGFRVSKNREFFEIPVKDAVDAVLEASYHFGEFIPEEINEHHAHFYEEAFFSETDKDEINELEFSSVSKNKEPWEEMFETAEMHFYGLNDEIVDYSEAMKFYLNAIKLGSIESYSRIGSMYMYGDGVKKDKNRAFEYFKEGANKGDTNCFAEMAELFGEQKNIENAKKCWKKYFEQTSSTDIDYLYGQGYIKFSFDNNLELNYIDKLLKVKHEILEWYRDGLDEFYGTENEIIPIWEEVVNYINNNIIHVEVKNDQETIKH